MATVNAVQCFDLYNDLTSLHLQRQLICENWLDGFRPRLSPDANSRPLAKKGKLRSNPRYDPLPVNAFFDNFCAANTAWKVSKYGVFSGPYFQIFSPNTGKHLPEKLRILILFTQWNRFLNAINSCHVFCTTASLIAVGGCDFFRKIRAAKRMRVKNSADLPSPCFYRCCRLTYIVWSWISYGLVFYFLQHAKNNVVLN